MSEATNAQMQQFCDQRLRVRAEQMRLILEACADDKLAIDDEYARAVGTIRWTDDRTGKDNPPHLLQAGNSANPDDLLNYNAALDLIAKFKAGTFANAAEANGFAALYTVLQRACVRPLS